MPLRILHLRTTNFYGGPERQIHGHALAARDRGLHVVVGSFSEGGDTPVLIQKAAADGLPTALFDVRSGYDTRAPGLLRRHLQEMGTDVLCTHDQRSTVLGAFVRRKLPIGWMAFSRGFTQENWKVRMLQGLEHLAMRRADRVVAVSRAQGERLSSWRIPAERTVVVPNAVDGNALGGVEPVDLRRRFGFPEDAVVCVAAGRLSPEKGQGDLVEAAAVACAAAPSFRFVLFGDGPDREALRQAVAVRGLEEVVRLPGFEPAVLGCLMGADLLVNPSWSEGMPNVVLEAMALRVPVLATNVGGVPELIEDGRTGHLVPARDVLALAEALVRLGGDEGLRASTLDAAEAHVRRHHDFSGQAALLASLYEAVAGGAEAG